MNGIFDVSGFVVMVYYLGMIVVEMMELCVKFCELGGMFKVVCNCFVKIVFKGKLGEGVVDLFMGLVVIVYLEDFVVVLKVVVDYVKDNDKFVILGGFMEEEVFDVKGIEVFFKLLFCEEFIGIIVVCLFG